MQIIISFLTDPRSLLRHHCHDYWAYSYHRLLQELEQYFFSTRTTGKSADLRNHPASLQEGVAQCDLMRTWDL